MTDYRYSLIRIFPLSDGPKYAFFGINPSTADSQEDDATVRKWKGFVARWGGSQFVVGNCFAARSTDVKGLAKMEDPIGKRNDECLRAICEQSDILIPCWGSRQKIPNHLHERVDKVARLVLRYACGKPVMCFGKTSSGDPKHPLMLGYNTVMESWNVYQERVQPSSGSRSSLPR